MKLWYDVTNSCYTWRSTDENNVNGVFINSMFVWLICWCFEQVLDMTAIMPWVIALLHQLQQQPFSLSLSLSPFVYVCVCVRVCVCLSVCLCLARCFGCCPDRMTSQLLRRCDWFMMLRSRRHLFVASSRYYWILLGNNLCRRSDRDRFVNMSEWLLGTNLENLLCKYVNVKTSLDLHECGPIIWTYPGGRRSQLCAVNAVVFFLSER